MSIPIRGPLQLPARREDIELSTADDLALVGELAVPEHAEPVASLVTLHPLPVAAGLVVRHRARFASVPQLTQIDVEGGKHLWVGESQTRRVMTDIVAAVNPDALPLPAGWPTVRSSEG